MSRRNLLIFLGCLFAADALMIGALLGSQKGPLAGVLAGLAALAAPIVIGLPVVALILKLAGWPSLAERFPKTDGADAVKRQIAPSLVIGKLAMSNAVEWGIDDDHLHLWPLVALSRRTAAASIPWEHIAFPEQGEAKGGLVEIRAGEQRLRVPLQAVRRELEVRRAISVQADV